MLKPKLAQVHWMGEDDGVGKFEMKLILELGANHFGTKFCEHYYIMKLLEDV